MKNQRTSLAGAAMLAAGTPLAGAGPAPHAPASPTVTLVPTRDLRWGEDRILPEGEAFDFPENCAQALLDAGAVRRPAPEHPATADTATLS